MNIKKSLILTFGFLLIQAPSLLAQCAMCRATVENNVSNGEIGIGAGLNFGILYLFAAPYIAIMVIGYFWYKNSKANARKKSFSRYSSR